MKSLKINLLTLIALWVTTSLFGAAAPTPAPSSPSEDGVNQIKAFLVSGNVTIRDANNVTKSVARNDLIPVGSTVLTDGTGTALLVFSNGAAMQIKPNSEIAILKYEQEHFDTAKDGTFLRLNADPSKSTTELDVHKGTLTGEVKKLNLAADSSFTVDTPAGSAGIRGTLPTFTVERDSTGKVTSVSVSCAEGTISFKPATIAGVPGTAFDIQKGGASKVALATDVNGNVQSITVAGATFTGAEAQTIIDSLYSAVNEVRTSQGLPPVTPPPPPPPNPPNTSGNGGDARPNPPVVPTNNTVPVISE